MIMFSNDSARVGRAFDRAWAIISKEYEGAPIDIETSRRELARAVLAAATLSHDSNETELAEQALGEFRTNFLALEIRKHAWRAAK
jgi:hypothetical protein